MAFFKNFVTFNCYLVYLVVFLYKSIKMITIEKGIPHKTKGPSGKSKETHLAREMWEQMNQGDSVLINTDNPKKIYIYLTRQNKEGNTKKFSFRMVEAGIYRFWRLS